MSNRRVVYVATGEQHAQEAGASITSLWQHNEDMPVTMYVDPDTRVSLSGLGLPLAGPLELIDLSEATYSWGDKPLALAQVRYEQILYLDTDTRICGDIGNLFDLLTHFDLAAAHAPIRTDPRQPESIAQNVPASFPELNTGVVALRLTPDVAEFLAYWRRLHTEITQETASGVSDQVAFRIALFESKIRFTVLTPEYNCRFIFPTYVHDGVRILHGRWPNLERIEARINGVPGPRVFVPGFGVIKAAPPILLRLQLKYHFMRRRR